MRRSSYTNSTSTDNLSEIRQVKEVCHSCGLWRKDLSTSEYGSMSSSSHLCDVDVIDDAEIDGSCDCMDGSIHDDISENDFTFDETVEANSDDSFDDIWYVLYFPNQIIDGSGLHRKKTHHISSRFVRIPKNKNPIHSIHNCKIIQ